MADMIVIRAADFAAHKHRDQRRKGANGCPYINHPLAVARILAEEGGVDDQIVLAAALLHDTIEDTDTTADELRAEFGEQVAAIVLEVTDDKALPKARRKELQVEHAPHLSREAKLVKLADKVANLRDMVHAPPDWPTTRKAEYFDWARAVVAGLRGLNYGLDAAVDAILAQRDRAAA